MKKILSIFLVFLIILSSVLGYQVEQAEAALPVVIAGIKLSPTVLAGIGSLLVAAGVSFSSDRDVQLAAYDFYVDSSQAIRDKLTSMGTGVVHIGTELWTATRQWVSQTFNQGSNVVQSPVFSTVSGDVVPGVQTGVIENLKFFGSLATRHGTIFNRVEFMLMGQLYFANATVLQNTRTISGRVHDVIQWGVGFSDMTRAVMPSIAVMNTSWESYPTFYLTVEHGNLNLRAFVVDYVPSGTPVVVRREIDDVFIRTIATGQAAPVQQTYRATGQSVVDSPYHDIGSDLERLITVVENLIEVVGKNAEQVTAPFIPFSPFWKGSWRRGAPVGTFVFEGSGTYTGVMGDSTTGEWAGVWERTLTGQRVWTGTYISVGGLTWSGTAVDTLIGSANVPSDIGRWRLLSSLFTTRFPFSIPWDIQRAFSSFQSEARPPRIRIEFPAEYFIGGGGFYIDFSMFERLVVVLRWAILIGFNVSLILLTRRLIGANG